MTPIRIRMGTNAGEPIDFGDLIRLNLREDVGPHALLHAGHRRDVNIQRRAQFPQGLWCFKTSSRRLPEVLMV